jgi:glutathione peroxidase
MHPDKGAKRIKTIFHEKERLMCHVTRRQGLALLAGLAFPFSTGFATEMTAINAYRFSFPGLSGGEIKLSDFKGKPILIVNTASQCGFSGQLAGMEQLYTRFGPRGLVVIAVPSNDFGGQEPGGAEEIKATAMGEYHATFPITAKQVVKGADAHPFYQWTAQLKPSETPRWNFHKYLIGRDGRLAAIFPTATEPTDSRVISAIVAELGDS